MPEFPRVNTTALDAANYILSLAERDGVAIDPITLQKILYYCQCWALHDGSRLFDDPVEAWPLGPVVRNVWKAYSGASKVRPADNPRYYELDAGQMEMVQGVWEMLKGTHGFTLSRQTHLPGTAWSQSRGDLPPTAPSHRELDLSNMANDAAEMRHSIEAAMSASWDDIVRCQK